MKNKSTAEVVVTIRKKMRMTQEQFSKLTGITRVNIAKYEKGHTVPPGNVLLALMRKQFPVFSGKQQ
jgi:transcriptional regulator with XRE-family HTH domain